MPETAPSSARRHLVVGVVGAIVAAAALVAVLATPAARGLGAGAALVALLAAVVAVVSLYGLVRGYERAIAHVAQQADKLARGEQIDNTEPVAVAAVASLERVGGRVKQLIEARAHIVATERDLERARRMYRAILPLASVAHHGRIRIAGQCTPATETGGDWWTYRPLSGGRLLLVVGDATGHGVHSAMIGCAAHGAVEALSHVGEERLTPQSVLTAINAAIRVPGADQITMTCFAALFDPTKGVIEYANASHTPPLVASTAPDGSIIGVAALSGQHMPLDDEDSEIITDRIRAGTHVMVGGDVVILFSDGLVDRRDRSERAFGYRRLQQALLAARLGPGDPGIAALRDGVLRKIDAFAGNRPLEDDVTLVCCAID